MILVTEASSHLLGRPDVQNGLGNRQAALPGHQPPLLGEEKGLLLDCGFEHLLHHGPTGPLKGLVIPGNVGKQRIGLASLLETQVCPFQPIEHDLGNECTSPA